MNIYDVMVTINRRVKQRIIKHCEATQHWPITGSSILIFHFEMELFLILIL